VYRGKIEAEKNILNFGVYVMFFPQLVAGPIERASNFLNQIKLNKKFDYDLIKQGLFLMLWGFFKKIVIADRVSIIVNIIFLNYKELNFAWLISGIILFAIQMYCDFSGYTDIALGTANTLGYKLSINFNSPYLSKNLTEYWRKWHISLSTWFNDYVHTPLTLILRNYGRNGLYLSILLTFLLSGIWHGNTINFVIWGILHALGLIYEIKTKKIRANLLPKIDSKYKNRIGTIFTFIYVCFTYIFFRSTSTNQALEILISILTLKTKSTIDVVEIIGNKEIALCLLASFFFIIVLYLEKKHSNICHIIKSKTSARWSLYLILSMSILFLGEFTKKIFLYFNF
jgi:D-alanyl-lipoteichoic acid acyltransferase DltB (MBOAT superfamily)